MTTEDKFYFDRPDLINNEDSAMRLLRVLEFYDGEIDLCHYTTFDSLISILNNKTFRLTRADLLNDKCEAQLYSKNTANSLYVFSMTNSIESVAMWKMYGCTSGIKLRLKFSKPDFLQCLYNFTKDYDENSNRIPPLFGIDKNGKLYKIQVYVFTFF